MPHRPIFSVQHNAVIPKLPQPGHRGGQLADSGLGPCGRRGAGWKVAGRHVVLLDTGCLLACIEMSDPGGASDSTRQSDCHPARRLLPSKTQQSRRGLHKARDDCFQPIRPEVLDATSDSTASGSLLGPMTCCSRSSIARGHPSGLIPPPRYPRLTISSNGPDSVRMKTLP